MNNCNSENHSQGNLFSVEMLGPRQYQLVENVAVQDGWSVELRQRKGGKSEGQLYNVYVSPQHRLFYVLILAKGLSPLWFLCSPKGYRVNVSFFNVTATMCCHHVRKEATDNGFSDPAGKVKAARKRFLVYKNNQVYQFLFGVGGGSVF